MSAVEVTITGVIWDKLARTGRPVVIIGEATLTGLSVGGGPVYPPEGGGGQPPGIWPGPGPLPHPEHPIAPGGPPPGIWPGPGPLPHPEHPIAPGGRPPTVWPNPPEGTAPHPEHPIVLPDPPQEPIEPPIEWKAVWHPTEGWIVVGVPNIPHPTPSDAT